MMSLLCSLVFLAFPFLTFSLPSSSSSSSSSSHQLELITSESDLFSSTSPHILLDNILLFKEKSCSRELIQWNDRNHNFHHGDDAYKKYFMTDELALKYYHHENSPPPSSGCIAVCLSIGTSRDYVTDVLPAYVYASHGRNNFTQWYNLCQNVELGILSQYEEPVIVYSIHPKTEERSSFYTLQPRNLIWSTVHLCSKLQIIFANNTLILAHQACTSGIVVLNQTEVFLSPVYNVPQSVINSSLHHYWNQSRSISRTFTEFGFEKVRLPPELWSSISTYYRNNYQSYSIDYTQLNNFHTVNWWNSSSLPMKKIEIPPILEKYWSQLICQYVEMWSQRSLSPFFSMKQKVQHTSSTGLRVYSENSYILPHVENKSDTAFTVVINVDQTELLEPWVAQIYDFFGRLHEVVMFPGDILMYEVRILTSALILPNSFLVSKGLVWANSSIKWYTIC